MKGRNWRLFPEENPNLVIECDSEGRITYSNPEARSRFPDLGDLGWHHPLLEGIRDEMTDADAGPTVYLTREVDLGDAVFEQKIYFGRGEDGIIVRIYAHDVTALRRAERQLHNLARDLVVAQELERQRIARELHDQVGQELAALKVSLQLLARDIEGLDPVHSLTDAIELVDDLKDQIRTVARDLRPPMIDAMGLEEAIGGLCDDVARRTRIRIACSGSLKRELPEALDVCIYRFIQEALANAIAHGEPTSVKVSLSSSQDNVVVQVEDDGDGFDADRLMAENGRSGGMGLPGMQERIDLLGGTLAVESAPGEGARLSVVLPTT